MRLHVDTDLGDNPDDACALALLLATPGVEVATVTTVDDADGRRVEAVREVLALARAAPVPVVGQEGAAATLAESAQSGVSLLGLGPLTNLAAAERRAPGTLSGVPVTVLGGWLDDPGDGLPDWRPSRDTNVRTDPAAARLVWQRGAATWVPVPVAARAALRETDLPRLRACGDLGEHLAAALVAHGRRRGHRRLAAGYSGLPDDLVAFLFDPVAAATALGRPEVSVQTLHVTLREEGAALRMVRATEGSPGSRPTRVVTGLDGDAFVEAWLTTLEAAFG